jgi:CRISPR/Cas system-associated endoribonuclease Cas2
VTKRGKVMQRKDYLLCYDIANAKRLYQVRKRAYALALGGQKSAFEVPLNRIEYVGLLDQLAKKIDPKLDKINLIEVEKAPLFLGKQPTVVFDHGMIII